MYTKDLGSDNRSDRESIEYVDKGFPCLDVCETLTFIVKTVDWA
jgi:hypothetical protein